MAEIAYTVTKYPDAQLFEWADGNAGDTGKELDLSEHRGAIHEWEVAGSLNGATVACTGGFVSGETWSALESVDGDLLSFTAPGGGLAQRAPLFVKHTITGGTPSGLKVRLLVRYR